MGMPDAGTMQLILIGVVWVSTLAVARAQIATLAERILVLEITQREETNRSLAVMREDIGRLDERLKAAERQENRGA